MVEDDKRAPRRLSLKTEQRETLELSGSRAGQTEVDDLLDVSPTPRDHGVHGRQVTRRSELHICLGDAYGAMRRIPRKEVIQPQLPLRLPCYDFTPVTDSTFDCSLPCGLGHRLRVFPAPVV